MKLTVVRTQFGTDATNGLLFIDGISGRGSPPKLNRLLDAFNSSGKGKVIS